MWQKDSQRKIVKTLKAQVYDCLYKRFVSKSLFQKVKIKNLISKFIKIY